MIRKRTPQVVFQPAVYRDMQRGINQIVKAICPTLGPLPRVVAMERIGQYKMPEMLDNGGLIARRIIGLLDLDADAGAMFLRHVLWRVYEEVGDGTATTAVLFEAVYSRALRYIVAGGNAMVLRRHLEQGVQLILSELSRMAVPLEGQEKLAQLAESVCHDPPLAGMLGEILSIIGEYGRLEVRPGRSRELEREYVEGTYWDSRILSRKMATDLAELRAEVQDAAVLISDHDLQDTQEVLTFLTMAQRAGLFKLLIVARQLSESVTALLLKANRESKNFQIIAAKTPGLTPPTQMAALEDLGFLTGGRPLVEVAGDTLGSVRPQDLGRARRAWADRNYLGIVSGQGDRRLLRTHLSDLRGAYDRDPDPDARRRLRERIGKLMGGTAVLWVGAATELEIETRQELAERTAETLRGAVREGILPGGGVSLLACQQVLEERFSHSVDSDERAAYRILIEALQAPIRAIVDNAGYEPSVALAEISLARNGHGFDVRSGQVVDMAEAGIWDATAVLKAAVRSAVVSAALALTTDVLVRHKEPETAMEP
jgi:chaperonin GroEL